MHPFRMLAAGDLADAQRLHAGDPTSRYLAGGTTLVDLMKLNVETPDRVVVLPARTAGPAARGGEDWVRLDARATMAAVASDPLVVDRLPAVADALLQAASVQIRNMATIGGNLLQRTRCGYFRDTSWGECNRRAPGSGCAALTHTAWAHAVLGGSDRCVALYPGDLAQVLLALDAVLEVDAPAGPRMLPLADLHRLPDDAPHREHALAPAEIITGVRVPWRPWMRRSRYVKLRERASYAFALASAAVALDLDGGAAGGRVRSIRIALGGVATVPWRAREAERVLIGRMLDEAAAREAATVAFRHASAPKGSEHRLAAGRVVLVRALLETAAMEDVRG